MEDLIWKTDPNYVLLGLRSALIAFNVTLMGKVLMHSYSKSQQTVMDAANRHLIAYFIVLTIASHAWISLNEVTVRVGHGLALLLTYLLFGLSMCIFMQAFFCTLLHLTLAHV